MYTEEQVNNLSFEEKSKWVRQNHVTAARHFQYGLNVFFNDVFETQCKSSWGNC